MSSEIHKIVLSEFHYICLTEWRGHLFGYLAPLVFVFIYAVGVCLFLTATLFTGIGAMVFGTLFGFICNIVGAMLGASAAILVLFASSLFGLWELRLPGSLNQMAGKSYTGYFGSLFMGLILGIVAAPCIGPFVLGLLTWVASVGDPWLGFLVFSTLSLGLGFPLFILAIFSGQLQHLPRAGGWMIWVRKLMGWVLVGMAVYFIRPVLPEFLKNMLPVGVVLAAGLHLGWVDKSEASFRLFPWLKAIAGITCLAVASMWITTWAIRGPGVKWRNYTEQILQEAVISKKPVIIDFYADWCAPCREFDDIVFHHPDVVRQAEEKFTMIKVDVTKGGNPFHEQLLKQYGVKGVPTIVFLDTQGEERADLIFVKIILEKLESLNVLLHFFLHHS